MSLLATIKTLSDAEIAARRIEAAEAAHTALLRFHALDSEHRNRVQAAELRELETVFEPAPAPAAEVAA